MEQRKNIKRHSAQNIVDHLLLVFVVLTAISGKILDAIVERQQQSGHDFWLYAHIVVALGFTILSIIHIKHHWGWFRTLPHKLKARKKDSLFLLLTLVVLLVSGVFVTLCKTHVSGFIHAIFGFSCLIVSIYHFYVRHVKGNKVS